MSFNIILKNLKTMEKLTIDTATTRENAEDQRKNWRRVMGGRNWIVNRRPGLDTIYHLALTIEEVK
jgi:hypothetical protein